MLTVEFTANLWESRSEAAWVFASLPVDDADIVSQCVQKRRGFGSVRVEVTVGQSTWRTSVFPDKASGTYLLPVKRQVREVEGLSVGDMVDVVLRVLSD